MTPMRACAAGCGKAARESGSQKVSWYETDPGLPNDTEVLFLALLRVYDAASAAEAAEWAKNGMLPCCALNTGWRRGLRPQA
jgi:hypothetical protein